MNFNFWSYSNKFRIENSTVPDHFKFLYLPCDKQTKIGQGMIKTLNTGNKIKAVYNKHTAYIYSIVKSSVFPLRSQKIQRCSLSPLLLTWYWKPQPQQLDKKINKQDLNWKRKKSHYLQWHDTLYKKPTPTTTTKKLT